MGRISDEALSGYIEGVGERVARQSPQQDIEYSFAVIDSEQIDAFALMGGYVYITRALLVLLNGERELAAVFGHAIGHAALRHPPPRVSVGGGLIDETGAASSGPLEQVPYDIEQESEADQVALRMLAAAGFDPNGLDGILRTLQRLNELGGDASAEPFSVNHPISHDRVEAAVRYAAELEVAPSDATPPSRSEFVERFDGVRVGVNPAGGIFRGNTFLQPDLGIWLRFPAGWQTRNSAAFVSATAPDVRLARVMLGFSGIGDEPEKFARSFATGPGAAFGLLPRATRLGRNAGARAYGRNGHLTLDVSWLSVKGTVYQITGVCENRDYERYQTPFIDVALSLRSLTDEERDSIRERRLQIFHARAGETLEELIDRAGGRWSEERTAVVNAFESGVTLREYQRVKLPIERRYETPKAEPPSL